MSVSLCMIVKNEERMLERCLSSVRHLADEMVIVDTGSTDNTKEIAAQFGARVYEYEWDGCFANARNAALEQARMDWILLMDADDEFEYEDTQKLLDLMEHGEGSVCFFQTLSFMGRVPDKNSLVANLNVRLIRNHMGLKFQGCIHEQIGMEHGGHKAVISDIRVYHYGYLDGAIQEKKKRERNISLIQKELDKNPDDAFMLFNMGNEYFALERVQEAFTCYRKSYEDFDPKRGYSPKLIVRLMTCNDLLGNTEEMLRLADEGLRLYPDYTDLVFLRGTALLRQEKYLAAIASLETCLKMGEAPEMIRYMTGIGSYKTQLLLSTVYHQLGDGKSAMRYVRQALRSHPGYREGLIHYARLLADSGDELPVIKRRLARMTRSIPQAERMLLLSDVFYALRRYGEALAYAKKAAKLTGEALPVYDAGVCCMYLGRYAKAAAHLKRAAKDASLTDRAVYLSSLCGLLDGKTGRITRSGVWFDVLRSFAQMVRGEACAPLAEEESESRVYVAPIFSLLDILLKTGNFDWFDKARGLLNLITGDNVLLLLGKLYYRNGFMRPAYKELERSVRLTGKTDGEALDMMKHILSARETD